MKNKVEEAVLLTEEDYFNIMGWWIAATMMAEGKLRVSIRDSERDTINKISEIKRKIDVGKRNE
jgi:hypothetical protein